MQGNDEHTCPAMLATDTYDQKVRIYKRPDFWHGGKAYWQKFSYHFNSLFREWSEGEGKKLEPPVCPFCNANLE